ncbi:MAG: hypothetical protein Q8865_07980 [Bacillota bacterium]|nr:hypothetical protein [Bacillota bacterium]
MEKKRTGAWIFSIGMMDAGLTVFPVFIARRENSFAFLNILKVLNFLTFYFV